MTKHEALVKQVKKVIAEADKHTYSVSAIYGAYNAAFGKNDKHETCSSCLRNRVKALRDWLEKQEKKEAVPPQYDDPAAPGYVAPTKGVTRTPMAEGLPFDFKPSKDDPDKGTVKLADGTSVKAGTYITALGKEIAVQPGGKATIKEIKESDLL